MSSVQEEGSRKEKMSGFGQKKKRKAEDYVVSDVTPPTETSFRYLDTNGWSTVHGMDLATPLLL